MTLRGVIEEFRKYNGRKLLCGYFPVEDHNCFLHCLHMAKEGLQHAPEYLRPGKAEAVGSIDFCENMEISLRRIVWDAFAHSEGHRNILLMNSLAEAVYMHNGIIFVTIRGWEQ